MAKTNNISSKEFAAIAKSAKTQIKDVTFSPFFIVNTLNKVAKGDVSKIDGCSTINVEDVKTVAKVCKTLHGGRYAFDFALFEKDSKGRFCTRVQLPKTYTFDTIGDAVCYTFKGCNVDCSTHTYLKPVPCTFVGMLSAFAKVAKVEIRETEKKEAAEKREAEKIAKKEARARETAEQKKARAAKKEMESKAKELSLQLLAGEITAEEFAEKLAILKAA